MIALSEKQAAQLTGKRCNKHNAQRTEYDGVMYASKDEARFAAELDMRQKAGEIDRWSRQIPFELRVCGVKIARLTVDFEIVHLDKTREFVEVKGHETREWKRALKHFRAQFPDLKLTVIKRGKPCK